MSSNPKRKMERAQAREWSYEQYANQKRAAAVLERMVMAKAKVTGQMIAYLRMNVPRWAVILAMAICPKTVEQLAFLFVSVLPRYLRMQMSEYLMMPRWAVLLLSWPVDLIVILIGLVLYRPLKYIQGVLMRWGHTTSIRVRKKHSTVTMTVRNFWLVPVRRAVEKF